MSPAAKTNREHVAEVISENSTFRNDAADLFLRGLERLADVQKQSLDIAVQHNKEMVQLMKKTAEKIPGAPRVPMLDLASGAVHRYAEIEKAAIDFIVEQNRIWTDVFKDRSGTVRKSGESATQAVKQTMENSFAVQKRALEHAAAQTKAMVDSTRDHLGVSGTQADVMTDAFRRGVDTIVDAQKELLNLIH